MVNLAGADANEAVLINRFGSGCFMALRNPAAHQHDDDKDELSEQEGLEQLAAFSILARWIDAATISVSPETDR
jgi:hypothetical protein